MAVDLAAGGHPVAVGNHGESVGGRRGRELVRALGAHGRDVIPTVGFEARP